MDAPEVKFFPAPSTLKHWVVGIRTIVGTNGSGATIKTCPNGTPGIVFQLGDQGGCIESIVSHSKTVTNLPPLFLHGLRPEPSIMKIRAGLHLIVQVVLEPHALYTLFGMDASAVSKQFLTATELDAEDLQAQLVAETDLDKRVKLLESFLLDRQRVHGRGDDMVERALVFVREHIHSISVKFLLDQIEVTERQLHRHFLRVVGCSPQQYIRIRRVNEALRLIKDGNYEKLADIAYALHYYDQSHFIRDVKALSWLTPKSIAQSVSDFRQDEAGASYM